MKKGSYISRFIGSFFLLIIGIYCLDKPSAAACFFLAGFLFSGIIEYIARRKVRKWLSLMLPFLLCTLGCMLVSFSLMPSLSKEQESKIESVENIPEITDVYANQTSPEQTITDTSSGLYVTFFNLGQSDATLITCDGQSMLVDAGNPDLGTSILNKCYKTPDFSGKLTYLVLTHPHADHIGSAASVISHTNPSLILMPDIDESEVNTKCYGQLLDTISFYNIPCEYPETGDTYTLGGAQVCILYSGLTDTDNLNDTSLMLYVLYNNTSLLLTGDAEEAEETAALAYMKHADVFQAGHHGSATSNTKAFLDAVSPRTVVISCGADNEYGHPHEEAINRMKDISASIYRTDAGSDISFQSDGETIVFTSEPWYTGENGTDYINTGESGEENKVSGSAKQSDSLFPFSDVKDLYHHIYDAVDSYLNKTYKTVFP